MSDLLLTGIGRLVTNVGQPGASEVIEGAAVAISDRSLGSVRPIGRKQPKVPGGTITWVGPEPDLPDEYRDCETIDCDGRAVIPGFVDAHTHLAFGGDRGDEFVQRLGGADYEEILAAGGGIQSTVRATRVTGFDELTASTTERLARMRSYGTTTVEVKSGYGLEVDTEVRQLQAAHAAGAAAVVDVVPTYLGAHVVPFDRQHDRDAYVADVAGPMLEACAPLATYCDVFCDQGAFTVDETRTIQAAATAAGLKPRLHANQLGQTGGVDLAIEIGAVSADHLDHLTDAQVAALAASNTVATLLPTVSLSMRIPQPRGADLWAAGATVALATDCNPGTSYVENMQLVVAMAVLEMRLTIGQAVWSATRGGALALELDDRWWIVPGAAADLVILDAPSESHLAYRPGTNLAWRTVKSGLVVTG